MKASKKITILEETLDYLLICTMRATKNNVEFAVLLDTAGGPQPSAEVEAMIFESGERIKDKV